MNDKTVIRAGGGRFFTRLGVSDSVFLGGNPPFQPTANVSFGSADNPGGISANSLPLTVTTQSRDFKNPEAWNWNFTVERELPFKSVLSVGYVGRRGLHLQREANINQPLPSVVAANPGVNLDALRPYKGYNSIRETDNVASSMYNALQLAWNRRFSQRLAVRRRLHAIARVMDDGSNQRDIIPNTYDAHDLWGPSEFEYAARVHRQLPLRTAVLQGQQQARGQAPRRLADQRIDSVSVRHPDQLGRSTDYAGVGQDGSLTGGIGQYWAYQQQQPRLSEDHGTQQRQQRRQLVGLSVQRAQLPPEWRRRLHTEVERARRAARSTIRTAFAT